MRLTKNNIRFVKRLEMDGITYGWFVSMVGGRISDSREYINYADGKTVATEYSFDRLPAAVRAFVEGHQESIFTDGNDSGFMEYIIH